MRLCLLPPGRSRFPVGHVGPLRCALPGFSRETRKVPYDAVRRGGAWQGFATS